MTPATRSRSTTSQATVGQQDHRDRDSAAATAVPPVRATTRCTSSAETLDRRRHFRSTTSRPTRWSTGASAPEGVFLSGYQTVGQYLYIVGGFGTGPFMPGGSSALLGKALNAAAPNNTSETMRLNMNTGAWDSGPSFTPTRADFGLASDGSKLYAIGGDTPGGGFFDSTNAVDELDLSSWPGGIVGCFTSEPAGSEPPGELGWLLQHRSHRRRDLVDRWNQRSHVPVPG